ncbi:tetratricopeptide repeat protein [Patescibacteria group bacterium]|nr:tetratricopeptide repeat protein [Patescibacteria group bacterium]
MLYWIAFPVAFVSVIVLTVVLGRHWKEIRLLDPTSIKEERMRQVREKIIVQRFERVRAHTLAPLSTVVKRGALLGKTAFHAAYIKLIQLDRFYRQAKSPLAHMAPSVQDRIRGLIEEARSLARDLKWADAERRYLEVLSIDTRNIDAYKGLGMLYLKQKLYPQAKETFEFLMKIQKADDACFSGMAEIAEAEGDAATAEVMRTKALEDQPRSPTRHAELASFFLERGEPGKAWPLAKRAADLEPKSAKYLVTAIEAAIAMGNQTEARRRFDKLRLLSTDQPRLQSLKERIDALA